MCSFSETWHVHGLLHFSHFWEQSLARGRTPLHWAATTGRAEVVKLLLEAKASVTVKDNQGWGPRLRDVMGF